MNKKPEVHFEFSGFPAVYWAEHRARRGGGYHFGCLSTFGYTTLKEAQKEVKRLVRVYKMYRPAILRSYRREDFLIIRRVERVIVQTQPRG